MKNTISVLVLFVFLFIFQTVYAQGYFVVGAGKYVAASNFSTNVQKDISKYDGKYSATSETYESGFTFEITTQGNVLNIVLIYGATLGIEDNWSQDTTFYKDVAVKDGKYALDLNVRINSELNGIKEFRFVKCTYKQDVSNKNIKSEGIVLVEFKMFGEKEK